MISRAARSLKGPRFDITINLGSVRGALEQAAQEARRAPASVMSGQGIVLFAASREDFPEVLASARIIRSLGCELPVEGWCSSSPARQTAARVWSKVSSRNSVCPPVRAWH